MKAICEIALVLASFAGITSGVYGEEGNLDDSTWESCDLAISFEDALALNFADGLTPDVDEKIVPGYSRYSGLVQEIHCALWCIPSGGPTDDTQEVINSSLCALNHPNVRIRLRGVKSLGELRFEPATGPLVTLMGSDPSSAVREAAAKAIALTGSDSFSARFALQRAAKEDKCPEVRRTAQFASEIMQIRREDIPCKLMDSVGSGCRFIF